MNERKTSGARFAKAARCRCLRDLSGDYKTKMEMKERKKKRDKKRMGSFQNGTYYVPRSAMLNT